MDERLICMVKNGDIAGLSEMLRNGEMMSLNNEDRAALPRLTAALGQTEVLRLIAGRSHAIAWEPDEDGRDVLHHAVLSGNAETVEFAVTCLGFDPMRGDRKGKTALDLAADEKTRQWLEDYLGFAAQDCYRNPVRRGFYPDPSVVRVGEDYYMVNSTFVQFPCLPISHSRDLVHWHTIGHAIERLEWSGLEGLPGGHGYWAPDISYHMGRFWMIATLRRNTAPFRLQMITSSKNPEGPYDKPRFLDIDGIDPSIFTDVDGKRYVVINPGTQIAELSEDGQLLSEPEMIYYGSARIKTEGPHLLYRDGWYYIFQAEGGTGPGHMETVARSRSLRGPYQPCPHNPILGRREEEAPIRRSGHGKPFTTADGRWYMMYLCGRDVDGLTMLGRESALDPMTWTSDGWPMVNGLKGPSCLQKAPLPCVLMDEMEEQTLISPRTDPFSFAHKEGNGWRLQAGDSPTSIGPVSLLLQRQRERSFVQAAVVDASRLTQGSIAGLCGYYDENSFYLFGVKRTAEGWQLALYEQAGSTDARVVLTPLNGPVCELEIAADGAKRVLRYSDGSGMKTVGKLDACYLSDEGVRMGKRFTGATLGCAAVGAGSALFTNHSCIFTDA